MKKLEVLQSIEGSVSSIFSREDVIKIINMIDENSARRITTQDIERAIDNVINSLERDIEDVVDYTQVEFNINYDNRIEVESVGLHIDYIREALENNFMDFGEAEADLVELERAEQLKKDSMKQFENRIFVRIFR